MNLDEKIFYLWIAITQDKITPEQFQILSTSEILKDYQQKKLPSPSKDEIATYIHSVLRQLS